MIILRKSPLFLTYGFIDLFTILKQSKCQGVLNCWKPICKIMKCWSRNCCRASSTSWSRFSSQKLWTSRLKPWCSTLPSPCSLCMRRSVTKPICWKIHGPTVMLTQTWWFLGSCKIIKMKCSQLMRAFHWSCWCRSTSMVPSVAKPTAFWNHFIKNSIGMTQSW